MKVKARAGRGIIDDEPVVQERKMSGESEKKERKRERERNRERKRAFF